MSFTVWEKYFRFHFSLSHKFVGGIATKVGSLYYVTFIDDYSWFTLVYLLIHYSDVFENYCTFHTMVRTQFSASIKVFRPDLVGEYFLSMFLETTYVTIHQSSCIDKPVHNSRAQRKHRHLLDTA